MFLQFTIPVFNSVEQLLLQRDEPCVHLLKRQLLNLLRNLSIRFDAITACESLLSLDFRSKKNLKHRQDILIGSSTKEFLEGQAESGGMYTADADLFFQDVRNYFATACEYIVAKFPLTSEVLDHAEVADITQRKDASFESVEFFLKNFQALKAVNFDAVHLQFLLYQVEALSETVVMRTCRCSQLKDGEGRPKFGQLAKVMLGILVIPHSNADSERVFSCVRKNRTAFRPTLGDGTLGSLLVEKQHMFATGGVCHKQEYSMKLIREAKSATYTSLMKQ